MGKAVIDDLINTADHGLKQGLCALVSAYHLELLPSASCFWCLGANVLCEDLETNNTIKCHAELMFATSWLGLSKSRSPQQRKL